MNTPGSSSNGNSRRHGLASLLLLLSFLCSICSENSLLAASSPSGDALKPIRPGEPGVRPFWNTFSHRFIYPPAFEFKEVSGSQNYRFCTVAGGKEYEFTSAHPWDSLAPVWTEIPEGLADLTVEGLDGDGKAIGVAGKRKFYRSAGFSGKAAQPVVSYLESGRLGLRALYVADHVQYWLKKNGPDPDYTFYCYPAKVMGALVRAMTAYAQFEPKSSESKQALRIAERAADHLMKISMAKGTPFEFFPPTYSTNGNVPKQAAIHGGKKHWMMTHYPCDAAFGYLDLYNATHEKRFLDAAERIARTYVKTQETDGTWPLVVNFETGKADVQNRLVPTWVIFLFDRLERDYQMTAYAKSRARAWDYIQTHPLRTYAWDAQFEDTRPQAPYRNMAREQACDVATIIFEDPKRTAAQVEMAKDLLRFGEDQFVVWSPVMDPAGWRAVGLERKLNPAIWIPPLVLEQYTCYMPVARSSAVFIKAYVAAFKATGEQIYLQKARALGNGLVDGQQDQIRNYGGKGEIPTWIVRKEPNNWLNNSYYAAEALVLLGQADRQQNPL